MRLVAGLLMLLWAAPVSAQRAISLTFDDLPYVGTSLAEATRGTAALLAALAAHAAPADVFVEGQRVEVAGETEARQALLRRWRDAGHGLHNHSQSHLRYSTTDIAAYVADVARGREVVVAARAGAAPDTAAMFFRAPFNDLGASTATREALAASLRRHGDRLAPFTVDHSDWMYNAVYESAIARADTALQHRVRDAYLAHLDTAMAVAEQLADDTFGRAIPHVLLLHANRLNADHLGAMLTRLARRGYAFVPLARAVGDPAYATADGYRAHWGVSWLHRWRVGLGQPSRLREDPEPPHWLLDAYANLR